MTRKPHPFGVDFGGSGIKGAPVDTGSGEFAAERQRIETPKPATPEAVADVVADGLAKNRDVVWAPPILRAVFSAFRHLPRPLWRKVAATR